MWKHRYSLRVWIKFSCINLLTWNKIPRKRLMLPISRTWSLRKALCVRDKGPFKRNKWLSLEWPNPLPPTKCSKSKKGNNSFKNTRIKKSKWYAYLQMIRKHHVKFQNDRKNGVGGVTQTRCGTDARTDARTELISISPAPLRGGGG